MAARLLTFGTAHSLRWNSTTARVRSWLLAVVTDDAVRDSDWLRALVHRIAYEQQHPDLLQTMRRLYRTQKAHKELHARDAAFARAFDLQRFGGPWAERIGIGPRSRRTRPFPGPACLQCRVPRRTSP